MEEEIGGWGGSGMMGAENDLDLRLVCIVCEMGCFRYPMVEALRVGEVSNVSYTNNEARMDGGNHCMSVAVAEH